MRAHRVVAIGWKPRAAAILLQLQGSEPVNGRLTCSRGDPTTLEDVEVFPLAAFSREEAVACARKAIKAVLITTLALSCYTRAARKVGHCIHPALQGAYTPEMGRRTKSTSSPTSTHGSDWLPNTALRLRKARLSSFPGVSIAKSFFDIVRPLLLLEHHTGLVAQTAFA